MFDCLPALPDTFRPDRKHPGQDIVDQSKLGIEADSVAVTGSRSIEIPCILKYEPQVGVGACVPRRLVLWDVAQRGLVVPTSPTFAA